MVKRNLKRFPGDFAFQLTEQEFTNLRCQFGTSSLYGGRRYLPYAFTEQEVAMLSGVLNSDTAIKVNIAIMRIFVQINKVLQSDIKITHKLFEIEKRMDSMESKQNRELSEIYLTLKKLIIQEEKPERKIGFDLPGVN